MIVGVISDTHGLLRPEALESLRGSDLILHAGDLGADWIVPALGELAPVIAIRGNVDEYEDWAQQFPRTNVADAAGRSFYMLHDLKKLDVKPDAAGFSAVIFGHSHKPEFYFKDKVLYFNPGSAGPKRFKLPISVGKIELVDGELRPKIVKIG